MIETHLHQNAENPTYNKVAGGVAEGIAWEKEGWEVWGVWRVWEVWEVWGVWGEMGQGETSAAGGFPSAGNWR